jgi:hypothetical protein
MLTDVVHSTPGIAFPGWASADSIRCGDNPNVDRSAPPRPAVKKKAAKKKSGAKKGGKRR